MFIEFLRKIIPARPGGPAAVRTGTGRHFHSGLHLGQRRRTLRSLAGRADAAWQACIDEGLLGEAFPGPVGRGRPSSADRKDDGQRAHGPRSRMH
jgi:hypothetical protein